MKIYILIRPIKSSTVPRFGRMQSNFDHAKIHDISTFGYLILLIYAKFSNFSKNVIIVIIKQIIFEL